MKNDNSPARGMRDLLPETVNVRDDLMATITEVYRSYGYSRIETPCLEDIARLSSNEGGENEKLVYRILKRGIDSAADGPVNISGLVDLGLRFDLTVPLTRFYANNHSQLPQPFRSLQIGSVWRAERPQKGRYRQFTQCDIDLIGEPTVLAEAELIEATLAALSRLGLRNLTVRLSDRRLLTALAHEAGIPANRTGSLFITLDKLDKVGWDGVRGELLGRDFDSAAVEKCIQLVTDLQEVATSSDWDVLQKLLPSLGGQLSRISRKRLHALTNCSKAARSRGCSIPRLSAGWATTPARYSRWPTQDRLLQLQVAAGTTSSSGRRWAGCVSLRILTGI